MPAHRTGRAGGGAIALETDATRRIPFCRGQQWRCALSKSTRLPMHGRRNRSRQTRAQGMRKVCESAAQGLVDVGAQGLRALGARFTQAPRKVRPLCFSEGSDALGMTCGERRVGSRCEASGAPLGCFPMMVESSTRPARRRSLAPGSPPRAMPYLPPRPTGRGRRYLLPALAPNPTKSCCRVTAPATFFVGTNASSYRSRKREARHCFTRWATGEDSSPDRGKDGLRWTNQGKPSSEMGPAANR